ncbi:MAG: prepilin-type N-terminal cleavage/methylation domain-containing protein [Ilumatobacter sp.]|uniref:type II secretion system protein n=1 Tax=Ilumatobacter sp. TaxID=1967498 RepID=UPI002616BECA|nr:prepilin-type N-terminal cleavage/methylation domain-containing protein [Ilumatobacter sp.]MDJ0770139.1 prepilin-type N-terminal cleavage/methylation domain-containing protein [Ilumatobacter sp.]
MTTVDDGRSDDGFTLIETLLVISLLSVIVAGMATAFMVIVRTAPDTEIRINDARSTRGLATWLSHDTTSTPRFQPETSQGGIDIDPTDTGTNNRCGGAGTNVLHLRWVEAGFTTQTFVANYRYVVDGDEARVVRYTCSRSGAAAFGPAHEQNLTSGLEPGSPPILALNRVDPLDPSSDVESIDLTLTAQSGEQVIVQTGSRNPTQFFP